MDITKPDFLQDLLPELKKNIFEQAVINPDNWWYKETHYEHNNPISALHFSSNEKMLAAASDRSAYVFNKETNKKLCYLNHQKTVTSLCFDPSGNQLITQSCNGQSHQETRIYCVTDISNENLKKKKYQFYTTNHSIDTIFFDTKQHLLGITAKKKFNKADNTLYVFNMENNALIDSYKHNNWALLAHLSPSKTLLATADGGNGARLYDTQKNKTLPFLQHSYPVTAFCFNTSENVVATCATHEIRFYDTATQKKINSFIQEDESNCICFSQSGKFLAIGSKKGIVRIFAHYTDYTLEQLQLKKALLTWLILEKPDKAIGNIEELFNNNTFKCVMPYETALAIWKTFPSYMQTAVLTTMLHRIVKHGKSLTTPRDQRAP